MERRLAAHRSAGELHTDDELGDANDDRGLREEARAQSCVVEVRRSMDRWSAPAAAPSNVRGVRQARLAHRWSRRDTRRRRAGACRDLRARALVESTWLSEGGE